MDAAPMSSDSKGLLPAVIRYKLHLVSAAAFLCVAAPAYYAAPNFVSVLSYFWPLLLSTALFLAAIVFFGHASPPDLGPGASGDDIMDYVAGGGTNELEPVVGGGAVDPPPPPTRQEQPTQ